MLHKKNLQIILADNQCIIDNSIDDLEDFIKNFYIDFNLAEINICCGLQKILTDIILIFDVSI